jgi:predicted transcriptional regulator
MSLRIRILKHLQEIKIAAQVPEIADAIDADRRAVQHALHELDDDDLVIMRNGWYLASNRGMAYPVD